MCIPGGPGTRSVDYGGLELRGPLDSAAQALELKVSTTTTTQLFFVEFVHEVRDQINFYFDPKSLYVA